MNDKVKVAKVKAKKEKAESVAADKELELAKEAAKTYVALKTLFTSNGKVTKGEKFTCTTKELAIFKKHKAV